MPENDIGAMKFLSDSETKVDLLYNEAIAQTLVALLRENPETPVTIGVHGDWGAGKSSVLEMVEDALEQEPDVLCLKFNGWRFQGFEDAKIALIEGIVAGIIESRSLTTKAAEAVKNVLQSIDWLKVAKKAGGLAVTAFTGVPAPDQIQSIGSMLSGVLGDPTKLAAQENVDMALEGAKALIEGTNESRSVPKEIGAFRDAFDELLKKADIDQLVVLIDDLDRCLPDIAIETLEAIRLFVFTSRTAFVIAADEAMIEYAVRKHFPDLPESSNSQSYARNYLEKLVQIPFRIPALGEKETKIYVMLLLVGVELGEDDPGFRNLIEQSRVHLRQPWVTGTLDAATVKTALGDKAQVANRALELSDQIGPTLAAGTQGNPRQIKRFLNSIVMRQRTAQARGFGDSIRLTVLAKLMLAEQFIPHFFDQIAKRSVLSPDGHCEALAALEDGSKNFGTPPPKAGQDGTSKAGKSTKPSPGPANESGADITTATEWLASNTIRQWATVTPPLAGVDLRPYLFVSKDKKDYFGTTTALGQLAAVADMLLGSKIAVQAHKEDLGKLVTSEARQLFEAVRGRVVSHGDFTTEPPGVAGLIILTSVHPELQIDLIEFIQRLPIRELGPWAVKGWNDVVLDRPLVERLGEIVGSWSKQEENKPLKVAADGTTRVNRRKR